MVLNLVGLATSFQLLGNENKPYSFTAISVPHNTKGR